MKFFPGYNDSEKNVDLYQQDKIIFKANGVS